MKRSFFQSIRIFVLFVGLVISLVIHTTPSVKAAPPTQTDESICRVTPIGSKGANLREGPGIEFAKQKRGLGYNNIVQADGQFIDSTGTAWYRLVTSRPIWVWVSSQAVYEMGPCTDLPFVQFPEVTVTQTGQPPEQAGQQQAQTGQQSSNGGQTTTPGSESGCTPSISISMGAVGAYGSRSGGGCYATFTINVSCASGVTGSIHVWNSFYGPEGNIEYSGPLPSFYSATLGGDDSHRDHEIWVESSIGSTGHVGVRCG